MTKTMREVKLELDDIFEDIQSYRGPLPTEDKLFEDVWNWHISQLQSVFEEINISLKKLIDVDTARLLGDKFEEFGEERCCNACGFHPERQRELVFKTIEDVRKKHINKGVKNDK